MFKKYFKTRDGGENSSLNEIYQIKVYKSNTVKPNSGKL